MTALPPTEEGLEDFERHDRRSNKLSLALAEFDDEFVGETEKQQGAGGKGLGEPDRTARVGKPPTVDQSALILAGPFSHRVFDREKLGCERKPLQGHRQRGEVNIFAPGHVLAAVEQGQVGRLHHVDSVRFAVIGQRLPDRQLADPRFRFEVGIPLGSLIGVVR